MKNAYKNQHLRTRIAMVIAAGTMLVSFQNCAQWLGGNTHSSATASSSSTGTKPTIPVVPFSAASGILVQHCGGCHSPTSKTPTTALPDIGNQSQVESSAYVKMGTPQTSKLYLDIIDGVEPRDVGTTGSKNTALSATEIETVRQWLLSTNINSDVLIGNLPDVSGGGTTATGVSYSASVFPILMAKCIGCHNGVVNANNFNMFTTVQAFANAGSMANDLNSTAGANPMPPVTSTQLTAAELSTILAWIKAGAPNN